MSFDADDVREEVAEMFARMGGIHQAASGYHVDHRATLHELEHFERSNAEWRAELSQRREAKRKERMKDPEYAARRKAQMKASQERRKQRMKTDPEFAERERERWRRQKRKVA